MRGKAGSSLRKAVQLPLLGNYKCRKSKQHVTHIYLKVTRDGKGCKRADI